MLFFGCSQSTFDAYLWLFEGYLNLIYTWNAFFRLFAVYIWRIPVVHRRQHTITNHGTWFINMSSFIRPWYLVDKLSQFHTTKGCVHWPSTRMIRIHTYRFLARTCIYMYTYIVTARLTGWFRLNVTCSLWHADCGLTAQRCGRPQVVRLCAVTATGWPVGQTLVSGKSVIY